MTDKIKRGKILKRPTLLISLFLIFSFLFIRPSQAQQLNLTDIPYRLALNLNIDTFSGQLICSLILIMVCILPVTIIARSKKASWVAETATAIGVFGVCVAIDWLPVWSLLVLCIIIALMVAGRFRGMIAGR